MEPTRKSPCGCVSRLRIDALTGDTNSNCHGFPGGVQPNDGRRLRRPSIVLVLWDNFFLASKAEATANQLITDLVQGPFMNALVQYGVGDGVLAGTIFLETSTHPAPVNWDNGADDDKNQVLQWVNDGTIGPKPVTDESSLLFFIFLPTSTTITNGKNSDGSPNTNICGWHKSQKFNSNSQNNDLFWGLVRTDSADKSSATNFVNSVAYCVGHELAEAFTDRDGGGYVASNGCEIGDICETQAFFNYRGWNLEQVWSNWDSACVRGDQAISLRKFLAAMNVDPKSGVRQLGLSELSRTTMSAALP